MCGLYLWIVWGGYCVWFALLVVRLLMGVAVWVVLVEIMLVVVMFVSCGVFMLAYWMCLDGVLWIAGGFDSLLLFFLVFGLVLQVIDLGCWLWLFVCLVGWLVAMVSLGLLVRCFVGCAGCVCGWCCLIAGFGLVVVFCACVSCFRVVCWLLGFAYV